MRKNLQSYLPISSICSYRLQQEVAKELKFTEPTIYSWIKRGVIKSVSIGEVGRRGSFRIERCEIDRIKKGLQ
jgi:excisionase family DNA binding protein